MNRKLHALTILALSAAFAIAQTAQAGEPVAYLYVASNLSGSENRLVGYTANSEGELTEIPGSPWPANLAYLATNGAYLFGSTNNPTGGFKDVFSYRVESTGALKYAGTTNIQDTGPENACNWAQDLFLDHTGSYLYIYVYEANCDTQAAYQSFAIDRSTGRLHYLGVTDPSVGFPLTMLADNDYAYAGGNGIEYPEVCGYNRAAAGNLVDLANYNGSPVCNTAPIGNKGQPSGAAGYIGFLSADSDNHLAANVAYLNLYTGAYIDTRIATITIDTASGKQLTSSTYANMPETMTPVSSLVMAPGGKLLAVGGSSGIQIFNFHPSGQATPRTGLISTADVTGMYWDNSNHLYAISNADNTLRVFTVTRTSVQEAPGSPYSIPHPVGLTGHSM